MEKMQGFINFNKPKGFTTFDCIRFTRKALRVTKAGHSGNLDPHSTGVVVLGIGIATRLLPYIMDMEKVYLAEILLGVLTDTWDITGEIILKREVPNLDKEDIKEVCSKFQGEIFQIPPPYSAVKKDGKRLYEYAREGIVVSTAPKKVQIKEIELVKVEIPKFTIRVKCSKGTYIRALAKDISESLGTIGIVNELIRERVGHFSLKESVKPEEITRDKILSIDYGVIHLPEIVLKEKAARRFLKGLKVEQSGFSRFSSGLRQLSHTRIYDEKGNFIGIGQIVSSWLVPKKIIALEK